MRGSASTSSHLYGLTEIYGPASVCAWHDEWDGLPADEQAGSRRARACATRCSRRWRSLDPETMEPVPRDGETIGEIMLRGNTS